MMKSIKSNIKFSIILLVSLVLLAIFNYYIFNYRIIREPKENIGIFDINEQNIEYDGFEKQGDKLISIQNDASITITIGKYIEKLNFNYSSDQNFNISEKTEYYEHNVLKTSDSNSLTSSNINLYSKNLKKNVSKIKLTFNNQGVSVWNFKIKNEKSFNFYTYIFFSIIIFDIYFLIYRRKKFSEKPEKLFLLFSLSAGIMLAIMMPPIVGGGWDEHIHFKHAYDYSIGDDEKYSLSANQYNNLYTSFSMADTIEERNAIIDVMDKNGKLDIERYKDGSNVYKSIVYLPSSITLCITRKLGLSFTLSFILSKFVNLLLYSFITYYAIKLLPKYKYLFTYISLFPMTLFVASQYSYDVFVNSFLFLGFSIFLNEKSKSDEKLNKKNVIIFVLSVVLASIAKAIYIPFILLMLTLPKAKFKSEKNNLIFKIGIVCLFLILLSTFFVTVSPLSTVQADVRGGSTSISGQISYIFNNIIKFIILFVGNIGITIFENLFTTMSFAYYGKMETYTIILIMIIGLVFFFLTDEDKRKILNKKEKIIVLAIVVLIICFIYGAMYLSFTPVGSMIINGVQPRYFIPLLFPMLYCIKPTSIKCNMNKEKYYLILCSFVTICLFSTIYMLVVDNYCF